MFKIIYNLKLIILKILKTDIETNLTINFINYFKFLIIIY